MSIRAQGNRADSSSIEVVSNGPAPLEARHNSYVVCSGQDALNQRDVGEGGSGSGGSSSF